MSADEILKGLDKWHEGVPEKLLLEAVKQKEVLTPGLIAALEEIANDPQTFLDDPERNLYYWAIYLLTHFDERRALPAILKLFRLGAQGEELVLDIVVEDGAMILANVAGENIGAVCELLHDSGAGSAAREAAADALGLLLVWGEVAPERVEDEFRRTLNGLVKNEFLLATVIVNAAVDLNLRNLAPDITRAFDRKMVDPQDFEFVAEWLHDPDFEPLPPYAHITQSIDDIVDFFEEKATEVSDPNEEF